MSESRESIEPKRTMAGYVTILVAEGEACRGGNKKWCRRGDFVARFTMAKGDDILLTEHSEL